MNTKKEKKVGIKERIKSFEDAMKATGRPDVPDFSNLPEDIRKYFIAQYKMLVITEALNEGWNADWNNYSEYKYFPYFYHNSSSPSGFAFCDSNYGSTGAPAGGGSRLCYKTRALSDYSGKQFIDIWNDILLKVSL